MQEKGNISIHTENIFPIIKKFLYSDNEIFLRELVANAVDATQKVKRLSSLGEVKGDLGELKVEVAVQPDAKTITIKDSGIGMTAEEVKKYINQVAFSGATEFVEKFKEAKDANEIIGKFGLGFYSAFMVADVVEIDSLSFQEGAQPVKWTCDGSTSFEISEGSRAERGTTITLHINEESAEFLEKHKLEGILNKYGKFLPIPIQFGTRTISEPNGVDEEGNEKYQDVEIDNIINNTAPIWTKSPSELNDEDYLNFYRELYPMSEDPLFWIHLNVDYPFNLTGVLYFPKVKNEVELQRNKIKLFSRQVFITDEVKDIVPEFLMLLHGVIDSPDIPLNVSRSFLQADGNVKKINTYITKKVADKLSDLYKQDRKDFESKWEYISLFIKYGMITEDKFYDKAKDFALLESEDGQFYTIEEYKTKVNLLQTDKNGQVVILYSNDKGKQDAYIQAAKKKGYDVLLFNSPIDNHFIAQLEQKLEKTQIKRVDADIISKLIEKDEALTLNLSEDEATQVKTLFEKAINNTNMNVEIIAGQEDELPVTVTQDEFTRRMKDMAKTSGGGGMFGFYGAMPDNYKVSVNGNSAIVKRLLANNEGSEQLARQSFDLALLSQGLLQGEALTAFVNRSLQIIASDN